MPKSSWGAIGTTWGNCSGELDTRAGRAPPVAQTPIAPFPQVLSKSYGNILEAGCPPVLRRCAAGPRGLHRWELTGQLHPGPFPFPFRSSFSPSPELSLAPQESALCALGRVYVLTYACVHDSQGLLVAPGIPCPASVWFHLL